MGEKMERLKNWKRNAIAMCRRIVDERARCPWNPAQWPTIHRKEGRELITIRHFVRSSLVTSIFYDTA